MAVISSIFSMGNGGADRGFEIRDNSLIGLPFPDMGEDTISPHGLHRCRISQPPSGPDPNADGLERPAAFKAFFVRRMHAGKTVGTVRPAAVRFILRGRPASGAAAVSLFYSFVHNFSTPERSASR